MKIENISVAKILFKEIDKRERIIEAFDHKYIVELRLLDSFRSPAPTGLFETEYIIISEKVKDVIQKELEDFKIKLLNLE
jgi:hypothetical protein